jgi:hypothetical protein
MNANKDKPGFDECLMYEKVIGVVSTIHMFYPYDEELDMLKEILNSCLVSLQDKQVKVIASGAHSCLISLVEQVIMEISNKSVMPDKIAESLFNLYLHALVASCKLQDQYGYTTPFWEKFNSRLEGAVFGWALGGSQARNDDVLRSRIIEFCREHGCAL